MPGIYNCRCVVISFDEEEYRSVELIGGPYCGEKSKIPKKQKSLSIQDKSGVFHTYEETKQKDRFIYVGYKKRIITVYL